MTIDKYEPIYPFRAENFKIVITPDNPDDWSVADELEKVENEICKEEWNMIDKNIISHILESEDVFYGHGFVDSPNAPLPSCIEEVLDMQMNQRMCFNFNKPIC